MSIALRNDHRRNRPPLRPYGQAVSLPVNDETTYETWLRVLSAFVLAGIATLIPEAAPNRATLIFLLIFVIAPTFVLSARLARILKAPASDRWRAIFDVAVVLVASSVGPHLWFAGLIALVVTLNTHTLRLDRAWAIGIGGFAFVPFAALALLQDVNGWSLPLVAAFATLLPTTYYARRLREHEADLAARLTGLMDAVGAVGWVDDKSGDSMLIGSVPDSDVEPFQFLTAIGAHDASRASQSVPVSWTDAGGATHWYQRAAISPTSDGRSQGLCFDVTDLVNAQADRSRLLQHDPLTGLPNREHFLHLANRHQSTERSTVMCVALGGLTSLLDHVGVEGIEVVVREQSRRIVESLPSECIVGRIGPGHFGIVHFGTELEVTEDAAQLVHRLEQELDVSRTNVVCRGAVGVATWDRSLGLDSALLPASRAAGEALSSRTYLRVSRPVTDEGRGAIAAMSRDLGAALDLWFQPILELKTSSVVAVEALVREKGGSSNSAWFVPGLEDLGLAAQLDACTFGLAAHAARQLKDLTVAVNISHDSLMWPGFANFASRQLDRLGVAPDRITIEISERGDLLAVEAMRDRLEDLRSNGFRLAIDDYGTGQSSLERVRTLPIDELKIDQGFITELDTSSRLQAIVASTVAMSRDLGILTVAEGVEKPATRKILEELGCDRIQGYLIGKASPLALVARGVGDGAGAGTGDSTSTVGLTAIRT